MVDTILSKVYILYFTLTIFFYVSNYWQVYGETVKKMALSQFIVGTPLQTLCLLAAGQPADVFSSATTWSSLPSSVDKPQQPAKVIW